MSNTYTYPKKEDLEIIIGDEKQQEFKPRLKIKRWDNEVNFSVGVVSAHAGTDSNITDKVEWDDGHGTKARFYEKDNDKFEFEIEIESKPTSNVLHFSIETKGLDFFYQHELTEDKIKKGYVMPENVIGSYAVYHKNMQGNYIGGNNYRTGKAFHIYRPYATDSNGWEVWCDLNIEDDMQITIPQHFIDNAVYPIIVDPTFGCNPASPGGTRQAIGPNTICGVLYTSPGDVGTADSISINGSVSYGGGNFKSVLVLHSNLNIVNNGIGNATSAGSASPAWYTSTFSTSPSLSASTGYLLSYIKDSWYGKFWISLDESYPDRGHLDGTNSYSSPTNPTDASHTTDLYSIYCTYTAAPGGGGGGIISNALSGPFIGPFGGPI